MGGHGLGRHGALIACAFRQLLVQSDFVSYSRSTLSMAEKIRWSTEPATIEALGSTKVRNLGGFVLRNGSPSAVAQRFAHWVMRWQNGVIHVPRVGMRPFWIMGVFLMVHQYAIRYNFSPLLQSHRWRKYH